MSVAGATFKLRANAPVDKDIANIAMKQIDIMHRASTNIGAGELNVNKSKRYIDGVLYEVTKVNQHYDVKITMPIPPGPTPTPLVLQGSYPPVTLLCSFIESVGLAENYRHFTSGLFPKSGHGILYSQLPYYDAKPIYKYLNARKYQNGLYILRNGQRVYDVIDIVASLDGTAYETRVNSIVDPSYGSYNPTLIDGLIPGASPNGPGFLLLHAVRGQDEHRFFTYTRGYTAGDIVTRKSWLIEFDRAGVLVNSLLIMTATEDTRLNVSTGIQPQYSFITATKTSRDGKELIIIGLNNNLGDLKNHLYVYSTETFALLYTIQHSIYTHPYWNRSMTRYCDSAHFLDDNLIVASVNEYSTFDPQNPGDTRISTFDKVSGAIVDLDVRTVTSVAYNSALVTPVGLSKAYFFIMRNNLITPAGEMWTLTKETGSWAIDYYSLVTINSGAIANYKAVQYSIFADSKLYLQF